LSKENAVFPTRRSRSSSPVVNPKRVYASESAAVGAVNASGDASVVRVTKVYRGDGDAYNEGGERRPGCACSHRDLKLEALADVLQNKLFVQIHCYRADEFQRKKQWRRNTDTRFVRSIMRWRCTRSAADRGRWSWYCRLQLVWRKVRDVGWDSVERGDVMREGVHVALKGDSNVTFKLNQEAGKMVHYGGATRI
jgi:hypothetical protein